MTADHDHSKQWLLTLPSLAWLSVFFIIPCALVLVTAFRPADLQGGVGVGWSWANLEALRDPAYVPVLLRTVWISGATTLLCVTLALPMSLHMARVGQRTRRLLLLLVVIPFLSNFLIRVFAWKSLLHPEGFLTRLLIHLHLVPEGVPTGKLQRVGYFKNGLQDGKYIVYDENLKIVMQATYVNGVEQPH